MKQLLLLITLIIGIQSSFAGILGFSTMEPKIEKCNFEKIKADTEYILTKEASFSNDISIYNYELTIGDQNLWSEHYNIVVEFPYNGGKNRACHIITLAMLSEEFKCESIAYSPSSGRKIAIPMELATYDNDGTVGSTKGTRAIRVNQASGTVVFE